MSNDLISRKAVIQVVDKHTTEDGKLDDDISVIVEEIPTAYDVDSVCEEIEKIQAGFDCRKCPEGKKESKVCEKDCGDELIKLIKQIVRNGGKYD